MCDCITKINKKVWSCVRPRWHVFQSSYQLSRRSGRSAVKLPFSDKIERGRHNQQGLPPTYRGDDYGFFLLRKQGTAARGHEGTLAVQASAGSEESRSLCCHQASQSACANDKIGICQK
jgi:hypothetical protein